MAVIDLQVGDGADDGRVWGGTNFDATGANSGFGPGKTSTVVQETWHRFTGSFPALGDTIDLAHFEHNTIGEAGSGANVNVLVSADDQAEPTAPTTAADFNGRTRTTAQIAWNDIETTNAIWHQVTITSVIAELVADYTVTAVQILGDNNGSAANNYHKSKRYEDDSALAAKLHIEYTAVGGRRVFVVS